MPNMKDELKKTYAAVKQQEYRILMKIEKSPMKKLMLLINNTVYQPFWRMRASEMDLQTATEDAQLNIEFIKSKIRKS